jgi:hypothetical protein
MTRGVKLEYSDDDLRKAVRDSTSWRGVMRSLGYATTNGRLATALRLRCEAIALDTTHFDHRSGPRRKRNWPAADLQAAINVSSSWSEVVGRLGLSTGNGDAIARVRGIAARLGLDSRHFTSHRDDPTKTPFMALPDARHLRMAATSMAMAWFARRGYVASLPVEPRPYDLLVEADGMLYRVQVKTATGKDPKSGRWMCSIGRQPLRDGVKIAYDPADVDFFFIVDADGCQYLVPLAEVGGTKNVTVSTIAHRQVA